jgi:hypothetical protein
MDPGPMDRRGGVPHAVHAAARSVDLLDVLNVFLLFLSIFGGDE